MPLGSLIKPGAYPLCFWVKNGNVRMDAAVSEWERLKYAIMREKYNIRSGLALDSKNPGTATWQPS